MKLFKAAVLTIMLAVTPFASMAQEHSQAKFIPDAAKLGSLIDILKDDALRQQLIGELEQLQKAKSDSEVGNTKPAETEASRTTQPTAEEDAVISGGLFTGISSWLGDLGHRLPTAALGAPIDVKVLQAEAQVNRRLDAPGAIENLKGFMLRSALGWAAITALALIIFAFAKRRIRARVGKTASNKVVIREVVIRAFLAVVPFLVFIAVASFWPGLWNYSEVGAKIFVVLSVPFAIAITTSGLVSSFLVFLARSKGWRLVAYAQRRLSPLVGILIGIATAGSIAVSPDIRSAAGPATSDILSLILDIAVPAFAMLIIVLHRRTVRSLIVRGHSNDSERSAYDRAIFWVGTHWQHFGFAFAVLNIGARIFGTQSGSFLAQSSLSVAVIVLAFMAVTSIRRFEAKREAAANRRLRIGVRAEVLRRLSSILYRAIQVALVLIASVLCLRFWGIDVAGWLSTSAGISVVGPVSSIVLVMLIAWTLWVALDAWITAALSESQVGGGFQQRSARIRTLLPLLRNVAFVVLSVLTVIGVLANLGINVAPLIAGAGVVGLAVGFGSQQLVQDVITGLFILLEDTLAIGDVIDTGDRAGTVEALTIRTVKIRDGDGALHTIPFSTVKALKNSSRGFGVYTVGVMLDQRADVGKALEVLKEVGDEVRRDPKYAASIIAPLDIWGVDQVGPDGILIKGAIKTRPLQQYGVGREINRKMNFRLQELGIPLANRNVGWLPPGPELT
ncbi:mechanosensitive ion channel domain-containing protein [Neorhizobium sp. JUb45]|uniref:mechanosensitive ion channel domain-containing protein n=1 Tax=Neorhizobium sp. JUb45 TaxID=2485113 RepID=UPI001052FC99|nr:mechanosensitive ion channel domain-containing protein [Neorhizobium sp. JUb45]TCQ95411.1 small-conductance mechanosensitive channel [Neorhizobium sp. JUb45]